MTSGQNCTKSPEQIKEQMKKKTKKKIYLHKGPKKPRPLLCAHIFKTTKST